MFLGIWVDKAKKEDQEDGYNLPERTMIKSVLTYFFIEVGVVRFFC